MNFILKNKFTALKTVLLKPGFETENLIFFLSLIKFELLHVILHLCAVLSRSVVSYSL